jgi:hypothetical protein
LIGNAMLCCQTTKLRATSIPLSTAPRATATAPRLLGSHRREAPYLHHHGPCGGALLALQLQPCTSRASFREVISSTLYMKSIDCVIYFYSPIYFFDFLVWFYQFGIYFLVHQCNTDTMIDYWLTVIHPVL